jgi:hypothetical protein
VTEPFVPRDCATLSSELSGRALLVHDLRHLLHFIDVTLLRSLGMFVNLLSITESPYNRTTFQPKQMTVTIEESLSFLEQNRAERTV